MEQLIQTVAQKAGISPEAAKIAVEVVLSLVKSKLPAPLSSQLEGVINGNASFDDITKQGGGILSGLFGKK